MNVHCPALLVTAPASGHGKTSVTAALARHHSRNGLRVRCFKIGSDFIDPTILAQASGQPVHNLDTWIMGEEHCRRLLYEAATESELILVEGVMGLFDGTPSSADLAELFGLPILPVIDASSMAQTFAAVLHGLATFRDTLKVAGAVANHVGSACHAELLRTGLAPGLPLATLPSNLRATLPGRHLGLQLAKEIDDIGFRLDQLADAIGDTCLADLPEPVAFAPPGSIVPHSPHLLGKTIAVASDRAFCFLYAQNVELLRAMGAEVVYFSPLADARLPVADAIYLPGGYPELYGDILAANTTMRTDIRMHVAQGKQLLAECGGMMYLAETLSDSDGRRHDLLGLLPGTASMQQCLSAIGSQQAVIHGKIIRGHTFHYSTLQTTLPAICHAQAPDGRVGEAIYRLGPVSATYLHFYFPSNPEVAAGLFLP
jgi:cobyrinic acid a,c-diamide synthase